MNLSALKPGEPEELVEALKPRLKGCRSVEAACSLLCAELYERCRIARVGARSLILSRCYLSLRSNEMDPQTAAWLCEKQETPIRRDDSYLVLMGTCGKTKEWCNRLSSRKYRVMSLDPARLSSLPMLKRCLSQVGIRASRKSRPNTAFDDVWTPKGVFLIEEALGSELILEQDEFVRAHGLRSVVAAGTMLPSGAFSLWFGFSRHPIAAHGADPMMSLMPSFWCAVYDRYVNGSLFG